MTTMLQPQRLIGWDGQFVYDTTKPVGMKQKIVDTTNQVSGSAPSHPCQTESARHTSFILKEKKMSYKFPLATATCGSGGARRNAACYCSGMFTMGAHVQSFERDFAKYVDSQHCVMVNSGSSAILLMVAALFYTKNRKLEAQTW